MEKFKHIIEMEEILNKHEKLVSDLSEFLEVMDKNKEEYKKLIEYYYSEKRNQDLKDDENGLIPKHIKRGVLSEDEIYNLMADYYYLGIKLLELGTFFVKND